MSKVQHYPAHLNLLGYPRCLTFRRVPRVRFRRLVSKVTVPRRNQRKRTIFFFFTLSRHSRERLLSSPVGKLEIITEIRIFSSRTRVKHVCSNDELFLSSLWLLIFVRLRFVNFESNMEVEPDFKVNTPLKSHQSKIKSLTTVHGTL